MANNSSGEKLLSWWQLTLLGVASTIGTGFFLGASIGIKLAGPAVLAAFGLAGIGTYFVFEALASMSIDDPQKGSFRSYAKKAFGSWAGFSNGWVYWLSEMLIIGSQLMALSIFTQFWFAKVPLWVFATIYAVLGLLVIIAGNKGFDRVENILAVLKTAAIVMFIILALLAIFGIFGKGKEPISIPSSYSFLFPKGIIGVIPALIYGFFGFGGIEIMGLLAIRLKNIKEAPKSGKVMLFILTIIYIGSIGLSLVLVSLKSFSIDESPLITALNNYSVPFVQHFFHGVFIIAGFSTMVASLFAVIRILVTLAEDNDAPRIFSKKVFNKLELPALLFTTGGIIVSIILAILMPGQLYEHITTAAGIMLLYNWLFILFSYSKLCNLALAEKIKQISGVVLIFTAIIGTTLHKTSRPGFFISLGFLGLIGIVTLIISMKRQNNEQEKEQRSLFTKIKR